MGQYGKVCWTPLETHLKRFYLNIFETHEILGLRSSSIQVNLCFAKIWPPNRLTNAHCANKNDLHIFILRYLHVILQITLEYHGTRVQNATVFTFWRARCGKSTFRSVFHWNENMPLTSPVLYIVLWGSELKPLSKWIIKRLHQPRLKSFQASGKMALNILEEKTQCWGWAEEIANDWEAFTSRVPAQRGLRSRCIFINRSRGGDGRSGSGCGVDVWKGKCCKTGDLEILIRGFTQKR